jgi:methyl-accepting chemotaxis protein
MIIKMKIAHKVILGFSIILLLLFFASISSVGILSKIKTSTQQVDMLAIPIQKQSSSIQTLLLKQAKLSALISTAKNKEKLTSLQQQFDDFGQQISTHKTQLLPLLSPEMKKMIADFDTSYSVYQGAVQEMFQEKNSVLLSSDSVLIKQKQLDDVLEEASIILEDLSYLEDASKQAQIDRIIGAAGQIEGYLINLTDSTKAILLLQSIEKVKNSNDTINVGVSNIEQQLIFLQRLGEGYNTNGLIEQFVEQFDKTKKMLSSENNIFDIKIKQLTALDHLNKAFELSEQNIGIAIEQIEKLQQRVENNLSDLQKGVFSSISQGKTTTYVILLVSLILGSIIAFTTIRAMIVPLRKINKVLSFIAKGDLSRKLIVKNDDEYGVLSTNVNQVVDDLRSLIAEISENAHLLNSAAMQSSHETEQVTQSLVEQQHTIEKVTVISDELKESADDILSKATNAEQQMSDAIAQSRELESIANSTNDQMDALVGTFEQTNTVMSSLQDEAKNISSILETIQSISDQTNLLALNAAIEAARAGEAGRGFAVVADEVRLLASRTQESAREIHTMIESLQSQTNKAALDIDAGKYEANDCQQHTVKLIQTLIQITNAINNMHKLSGEIASSASLQNNLSNNINTQVQEVVEMSEQSCEKSTSTLSYSQQVAELSVKLEQSVGTFKV